jgi:hypothetical protein
MKSKFKEVVARPTICHNPVILSSVQRDVRSDRSFWDGSPRNGSLRERPFSLMHELPDPSTDFLRIRMTAVGNTQMGRGKAAHR